MHGVGFEPTRFATPHLECGPLDRSGIRAGQCIWIRYQFITLIDKTTNGKNDFFHSFHFNEDPFKRVKFYLLLYYINFNEIIFNFLFSDNKRFC